MDLQTLIQHIPDYPHYLSVDALYESTQKLKAEFPDIVSVETLGHSRRGDPMELIRIGDGDKQALVLGGSHSNEPLGCMVIEFFTQWLCEDDYLRESLGYTWHFMKCIDPDAARRNERWFTKPFSIFNYSRYFYRPPFQFQIEFTFTHDYKDFHFDAPLPETLAVQRAFDNAQPDLYYSLHCGGYGGVFIDMTEAAPELFQPLYDLFDELDFHILSAEVLADDTEMAILLSKGIYQSRHLHEVYDIFEAQGIDNPADMFPHGLTGRDVASDMGAFAFNDEVDVVQDAQVADTSLTNIPLADVMRQAHEFRQGVAKFTPQIRSAFADARLEFTRAHIPNLRLREPSELGELPDGNATVLQRHMYTEYPQIATMREFGQFLGLLDGEIEANNPSENIKNVHQLLSNELETIWESIENKLNHRIVPIRDLIAYQVKAGLLAAEYVRDKR